MCSPSEVVKANSRQLLEDLLCCATAVVSSAVLRAKIVVGGAVGSPLQTAAVCGVTEVAETRVLLRASKPSQGVVAGEED